MGDPVLWGSLINNHSNATIPTCPKRCISQASVYLTIISSVASIVGSLLIICTFLRWKDLRTIARMILVFLAIADLFSGLGYIFAAAIHIQYFYSTGYCDNSSNSTDPSWEPSASQTYRDLCAVQSFVTTLMPMASFFWTANLAIYLFFSVVWMRVSFAKTIMAVFHVTAWGIPLLTCIVMASTDMLGESESRSSGGWCWIKWKKSDENSTDEGPSRIFYVAEFFAGKGWEIAVCILALTLCIAIKAILWKRRVKNTVVVESEYSSLSIERQMQAAYSKLDQKLIWLPIAFLLLRIWGNIRFFISIRCTSDTCCHVLYHDSLVVLQSIGDPGQGWSNALLFVFFNQKIAQRLCPCLSPLGEWFSTRLKCLDPREWRREGERGFGRGLKTGPIRPVTADGGGGEKGEKDPLLFNASTATASSVTTNFSSSSVLYSTTANTTAASDDDARVNFSKPRNPSINSAKS